MLVRYIIAIVLGVATGFLGNSLSLQLADGVSHIFMSLMKLVSLPMIFLSITSVATSVESADSIKVMGKKVVTYTLLTTVIAATVALCFFLIIDPVGKSTLQLSAPSLHAHDAKSYWSYLIETVPSNALAPFVEGSVIGVLLLALLVSYASFGVTAEQRKQLLNIFSSLFALLMRMTTAVVSYLPVALWAFAALFVRDLESGLELKSIGFYLLTVTGATIFQGLVILPLFLKLKGVSPIQLAKAMAPALTTAFFTKSSNATIPIAVRAANERASIDPKVSQFVFPLCTTINMNGCAAFILVTTLFVSMSYGIQFTAAQLALSVVIATIAAVGNAGVPMGCYFLSSAFLAAAGVPLHIMGVILPFYALIDAIETAVNVWSDSAIAAVVDKELSATQAVVAQAVT